MSSPYTPAHYPSGFTKLELSASASFLISFSVKCIWSRVTVWQDPDLPTLHATFIRVFKTNLYGHTRLNAPDLVRSRKLNNRQAGLVLGWVTAWEYPVPYPFTFSAHSTSKFIAQADTDFTNILFLILNILRT